MSQTIAQTILEATKVLRAANILEARREAGSLLANLVGHDRTFLITHPHTLVDDELLRAYRQRIVRRAHGEPLQYITGVQDFFGLSFEITRDALIPRPETELLVETALGLLADSKHASLLLDIGAGSGCITISLLHNCLSARAVALDLSEGAVRLAARNAARHGVRDRVLLMVSDSISALVPEPRFEMIVSNPPYIAEPQWQYLQREVKEHEPKLALTSGVEGLTMITDLLQQAPALLVQDGYFIFEIGYDQAAAVEELIDREVWQLVSIQSDLQDIPRTFTLKKR